MENKKFRIVRGFLSLLLFLFFTVGFVFAGEFSGNFKEQQGDDIKNGKLFVKGNQYSMEFIESDENIKVIVDTEAMKTTVIQFSAKEFRTIKSDDMMSVMNDPFQSYEYTKKHGEETAGGSESVGGYDCDKFILSMGDTPMMTKWVSQKLGFPIKIVAHGSPEKIIEVTDIIEGTVDLVSLMVPDGFTSWVDPDSKPGDIPDWAGDIESAPVLVPPFEKDMSSGDIVRVKIELGKSLCVKSTSVAGGEAKVIPFTGNNPQKDISFYNNFAMQGVICQRRHELSGEADEFVIRVYDGDIKVSAKWQDMFEATASAGDEVRYKIIGSETIEARFINITDGSATATFNYYKDGQPMSEDEAGPAKYRKIKLEKPWDVNTSGRFAKGDEMVIKVLSGKMQIKLGQYDSFRF